MRRVLVSRQLPSHKAQELDLIGCSLPGLSQRRPEPICCDQVGAGRDCHVSQEDWSSKEGVSQGEVGSFRKRDFEPWRKLFPTVTADHCQIGHALSIEFPVTGSPRPEVG